MDFGYARRVYTTRDEWWRTFYPDSWYERRVLWTNEHGVRISRLYTNYKNYRIRIQLSSVRMRGTKNNAFKKYCKTNNVELVTPLNPRDAFFGGGTNVTKLTYDFKHGEKGRYVDFVSLYPTVNFFKTYPVGHPTKILNPISYDSKWFGFVQCKIEAPRGLYHPVLPVRLRCGKSDKLLFPLCRTCAVLQQQEKCEHSSDERVFTGTWCTNEITLALTKGYRIIKIYEVWHFVKTSDTLFRDYVKSLCGSKWDLRHHPTKI